MKKYCFITVAALFLGIGAGRAQINYHDVVNTGDTAIRYESYAEKMEGVYLQWSEGMEFIRESVNSSVENFAIFQRFESVPLQALKNEFVDAARKSDFDGDKIQVALDDWEEKAGTLYSSFMKTKELYPTSVAEYAHTRFMPSANPCDSSGCTNMDFSQGTLNTWYGYYAVNNGPPITGWTGGALGPVTFGVDDPSTSNPHPDYQILLTSSGYDKIVPTIPRVSPWATGGHSVMLGDSTEIYQGAAMLTKTFLVTPNTANLTYQYALFLQNPGHAHNQNPFFQVSLLDENGDTVPSCGVYNVTSGFSVHGFDSIIYESVKVYYKNWTMVNVPLQKYIGHCVTIVFEVADCSLGGHFGYAYIDASCSPLAITTSSPNFCGQDSIALMAPPGSTSYAWTGPANGIISDTGRQTVWVDSAGTYTVICAPVTGPGCADTLTITIGNLHTLPPHPSFIANTVCAGQPMSFTNTSNPIGGRFSWDFYDVGNYNDTNVTNPTWTYSSPGTYTVKLNELYNGCGMDTLITVKVDSIATAGFTASAGCVGSPIIFTNTSKGSNTYSWNFGDPLSNPNDTSTAINGTHTYTTAATYTVTLVASNGGLCADSIQNIITVYAVPKPVITGRDTICAGSADTLRVSGGITYIWTVNGSTNTSIIVKPAVTKTYTIEAFNGTCQHDTSFTVDVVASPSATIISTKDSVCAGDTLTLFGSGGTTYRWSPGGSTRTTIHVSPLVTTIYTLHTFGGSCEDSAKITIGIIKAISASAQTSIDSICPGDTAMLTVTATGGQATYKWNNGATTSTIMVSPSTTTTYTVSVYGLCDSVVKTVTLTVNVCAGINEILNANQFQIYPNPNNGMFTIQSSVVSGQWSVSIYNELGQQVYTKIGAGKINEQINMENAAAGIYSLRLQTNNGSVVKKLVKIK